MRSFSILATALVFAFSVNAASYNKRTISSGVQNCITNLKDVNNRLLYFTDNVVKGDKYDRDHIFEEKILETSIRNAGDVCCSAKATSAEETNAVISTAADTVPKITELMDNLSYKAGQYGSAHDTDRLSIAQGGVKVISRAMKTLDNCLISTTPDVRSYTDVINNKLDVTNRDITGSNP